jgi:catechol 2,3-dioxygenase-like lactoylglutathione lyase family enzyme
VRWPKVVLLNNNKVKYAYIRDPDTILIELIELGMGRRFGGPPRIEGVNHVGIGVSNIAKSLTFYRDTLGFREVLWDHTGTFEGIPAVDNRKSPTKPIKMRIVMLTSNYRSAWIEIIQHLCPRKAVQKRVPRAHVGYAEFGIRVREIEKVYGELREQNVRFVSPPQVLYLPLSRGYRHASILDPDNLRVSLVQM